MLCSDVKKMTARCLRLRARDLGGQAAGSGSRTSGAEELLLITPMDHVIPVKAVLAVGRSAPSS